MAFACSAAAVPLAVAAPVALTPQPVLAPRKASIACFPALSSAAGLRTASLRIAVTRRLRGARAHHCAVVTEPVTGISFPSLLAAPGGTKELSLLGTGFREKAFGPLTFKVYGVGVYVDPLLLPLLAPWKGKAPADVAADAAVFKTIVNTPCEKAVVIVLARDVGSDQFWDALNKELAPRLEAAGEGHEALEAFGQLFKARALNKNTGVYLTWKQPSSLQVAFSDDVTTCAVPAAAAATINSSGLLSALFDVYLGPQPVSASLVTAVAAAAAAN